VRRSTYPIVTGWNIVQDIVVLFGASVLAGIVFGRLKQNAIVGYLLAGILLGPAGFGVIEGGGAMEIIAELGVALLLFTIGLEFSWSRLRQFGTLALGGGSLQVGLTMAVFTALAIAVGVPLTEAIVIGAASALSSTAVVLRVLTDRAELDSRHGRNSLAILLMQDVAVVPLVLIVGALKSGFSATALLEFAVAIGEALALVAVMVIVSRWVLPRLLHTASSFRNRDLPILLAFLVFLLATWGSHALGLSPVLGAFVAGMLLAESPFAEQIRADMTPLRAAFVTLFFTSIGMLVEIPDTQTAFGALVLGLALVTSKALIVAAVIRLFGRPLPEALRTGLCLSQIGEFSFVLAKLASSEELISDQNFQLLLTSSLLTLLATPYLIALAARIPSFGKKVDPAGEAPSATENEGRVLLVGLGPAGIAVAEYLTEERRPFLVLELNPNTVAINRATVPIEFGDATQREILEHHGLRTAAAIVITIPDSAAARAIIRQCKALAPHVPVITRARHHLHSTSLAEAGANAVVDEESIVGTQLATRLAQWIGKQEGKS
jgi:K+:H+ antiporter